MREGGGVRNHCAGRLSSDLNAEPAVPRVSPAGSKVQEGICLGHAAGRGERHGRREAGEREPCEGGRRVHSFHQFEESVTQDNKFLQGLPVCYVIRPRARARGVDCVDI